MPPLGAGNPHAVNLAPAEQSICSFGHDCMFESTIRNFALLFVDHMNSLKRLRSDNVGHYVNVPLSQE